MTERGAAPWNIRTPLAGSPRVVTQSAAGAQGVVVLRERHAGRVLLVAALRARGADAVVKGLSTTLGLAPPASPAIALGQDFAVVWSGPHKWLVLANGAGADRRAADVATAVDGIAAVIDQSSSRVLLQVSGSETRRVLAKVLGLDLHPTVFPVGAAAMTDLAHVPVHVWRLANRDGEALFEIAAPRSYAESVWSTLVAASAEYGLDATTL